MTPGSNQTEENGVWLAFGVLLAALGIYVALVLASMTGALQAAEFYTQHLESCSDIGLEATYKLFVGSVVACGVLGGIYLIRIGRGFNSSFQEWAQLGYPKDGFEREGVARISGQVFQAFGVAALAFSGLFFLGVAALVAVPLLACQT